MNQDQEVVREEVSQEFNARDKAEIDSLAGEQNSICFEYLRGAESAEVNPRPVPHKHEPHEEKASLSRLSFGLSTAGGIVVSIILTWGVLANRLVATPIAVMGFLLAEWMVKLGVAALWPKKWFLDNFAKLYVPPLIFFLLSASVILMGRVASADAAEVLIAIAMYAWWGMETSLLVLGALSYVAWKRFGWSGRLVDRYLSCESRITELKQRIDLRSQRIPMIALAFLALLTSASSAVAECFQVALDRTGSVADQSGVEKRLVEAIIGNADRIPCVNLLLFSDHSLNAHTEVIAPQSRDVSFINMGAQLVLWRRDLRAALVKSLSKPMGPARCTSLADIALVVGQGRWILITDGVHDCSPPRAAGLWSGGDETAVILVPSNTDRGNDIDHFDYRARLVRRYLPGARVVPGHFLESILADQAGALTNGRIRKAASRSK